VKISVLTPSYNSGEYLERSIESVLNQDYNNYEHIIIDGNSTDNTQEILSKYPHLIYVSEKDKGQSDAMNKAFQMSEGDIIVYLNADDYFEKNVFMKVIHEFKSTTDLDIVVGNLRSEFKLTSHFQITSPSIKFRELILPFKFQFPYNPVSYFYKRDVQIKIGMFPINNHYSMDYWFVLRAFKNFKVKKIDHVLGVFYHSGTNKTSTINVNSINKIAFQESINFGYKWRIYFILNYIPYLIIKLFHYAKKVVKYIIYKVLMGRKIKYEFYLENGFNASLHLKNSQKSKKRNNNYGNQKKV
jgi:glycosyltransferase involved in cell wall biosynthesis